MTHQFYLTKYIVAKLAESRFTVVVIGIIRYHLKLTYYLFSNSYFAQYL